MNETVETTLNDEGELKAISIVEIFRVLFSKILWIILITALCGTGAYFFTKYRMAPQYQSTVTIYAVNSGMATVSDITIATYYAEDFATMIEKRAVLEKVSEELDLGYSYGTMLGMIKVSIGEQSRIIDVTVTDTDPVRAQEIADKIAVVATDKMSTLLANSGATNTTVIYDHANLPEGPSGPSKMKNTMIAAMVGFFATCVFIVVAYMLDDKIKTAEHIEQYLKLSVLGEIPFQKEAAETKPEAKEKEA